MKIFITIFSLLLFYSFAFAQSTREQIQGEIITDFPSTGAGVINAQTLRTFQDSLVISVPFLLNDNEFSGNNSFSGTSTFTSPLTITPATGANKGFSITQITSGTPIQDPGLDIGWNANSIFLRDNGIDATGFPIGSQTVNGFSVSFESRGAKGIGQAIFGTIWIKEAPAQDSNTLNQFVAGQFIGQTSVTMGGTPGSEIGAIFGIGATALATNGATDLLNVTNELNIAVQTGASTKSKSVLSLAAHNTDAVSGSVFDTVLSISALNGAIKSDNGILFSNYNGAQPVKTTGALIATQGSATVASIIDVSSYTATDYIIKGPVGSNFFVTGIGNLGIGIVSDPNIKLQINTTVGNPAARFRTTSNSPVGPVVDFYSSSGLPSTNDVTGTLRFLGNNLNGTPTLYGQLNTTIIDATAGAEYGELFLKTITNGSQVTGLTLRGASVGLTKMTATASSPGAGNAKFEVVCGTGAGTAKLIMYAGTSSTASTVVDNVGAGVTGC